MTITATVAIACALLLLGHYLNHMATASHAQRVRDLRVRALLEDLEILRLLQQHRGLGAQHEAAAVALRDAVAASLTQRLQQRSAMPDPHAVAADWAQLRGTPADFDGHSRLIDSLIAAIDEREPLGQACRTLEDMARLRGLCVLASNQGGCTPGLQARLMSLCRRLGGDPDVELKRLIGKLERGVIHAQQPRLSPPQCFALITPLIDARLRSIQQRLQHDSLKGLPAAHKPG